MSVRSRAWLYLIGAIFLEVAGSLSLKAALDFSLLYIGVVVGYGGAFVCLSMVLRHRMPLGVAYGIWGATGVILTAIFSQLLFGEPLTALKTLGIVLIVAGVLLVEIGSQKAGRPAEAVA
ncbi:DMT family transporter [Flaviflexus huanghaiensis]|uniref:DMT family transporter n=1 Tax=Flaviflexus huanghaiensis TaxID=1111473 RepID=UPI0015FAA523|nr:multidrug efflux SMR transporter [Flaviflexus huanghaiensis]